MKEGDRIKELEAIIKEQIRLNTQLKDKVMFEEKYELVDYTKLDSDVSNRMTGGEWVGQWGRVFGTLPELR